MCLIISHAKNMHKMKKTLTSKNLKIAESSKKFLELSRQRLSYQSFKKNLNEIPTAISKTFLLTT